MKIESFNKKLIVNNFGSQIVLEIDLNLADAKTVVLLLILLQKELIETVEFDFLNFKVQYSNGQLNSCEKLTDKYAHLYIDNNMLGYFISFLLKYYKNGFGSAEHIDLDFVCMGTKELTVTVKLEEYSEYSHSDKITRIINKRK